MRTGWQKIYQCIDCGRFFLFTLISFSPVWVKRWVCLWNFFWTWIFIFPTALCDGELRGRPRQPWGTYG